MTITDRDFPAFGALLQSFRQRARLTQQQLAHALGVHRRTLVRWEQGDSLPQSKALVLELARHLHLDDQETRQLLEASLTATSPYWCVPLPRNPYFTGREEVLSALHTQLDAHHPVALTQSSALHGLGGVGKTQIALEYAYCYGLEYRAVFWMGAETEEQMRSSLLRMAEVLHLPEQNDQDQQRLVAAVRSWLAAHGQWLLIVDNVEDLTLLDHVLPAARSGAILLTTRCQTVGTRAYGLDLAPMGPEEGLLFLLRRAKLLTPDAGSRQARQFAQEHLASSRAATELVEALGGLPLALDQAGAYVEATQCELPAYLELLRTRRAALLQHRGDASSHHPASVSTTFTLALTALARLHPAASDLLRVCALVQPDGIPEELFRQGAEYLGPALQAACLDALEWNRVVGTACAYSLLVRQPEEQTLSMHRLVQAVLLDGMAKTERAHWNRRVTQALDAVFPEVSPLTSSVARQQGRRLLSHALLFLQRSTGSGTSLSLASLAYKTAQYLREEGRYTEAQPLFLRALHLYEQALGSTSREVAIVCNYLGVLYAQQGQFTLARPFLERALGIHEQLDPDHPDVARPLENLANLLTNQAQYAQALPLLQRVLRIREHALGPGHHKLAQTFHNLGGLYAQQEQYADAKPFLERALHLLEASADQPPMALTLTALGEVCRELGQYAEAQRFLVRAWRLSRKLLGPEHPLETHTLAGLGRLAFVQGSTARADRLYQRALRIWDRYPHHDPPELAILLTNQAELRQHQGEDAEAAALYQRALGILEEHLSPQHPRIARARHALALLGEQEKEHALAHHARSLSSQVSAETHPKAVASQESAAVSERATAEQDGAAMTDAGNAERQGALPLLRRKGDGASSTSDPLQAFLSACCALHPRAWCRSAELWRAYQRWAEDQHERYPLSRGAFVAQLKAHGCCANRTNTARIWRGIALVRPARDGG